MRRFRAILLSALTICMLLSLCACTASDPERELAKAREKLAQTDSMSYEMVMDMQMTFMGIPMYMEATCLAQCVADPLTVKMDLSTDMGGLDGGIAFAGAGGEDYTMYIVQTGDGFTAYAYMHDGWVKEEAGGLEDLGQYDARSSMDTYLSSFASVTEAGTEQVNGASAARYDCVVSSDAVDSMIAASGAYSPYPQLSLLGISEDQFGQALSGLGEMSYSIWIDAKSSLPVRCELDMSGIMGRLMEKILAAAGADPSQSSIDRLTVAMTISDYDTIDSIELPAGALDAEDITGSLLSLFY